MRVLLCLGLLAHTAAGPLALADENVVLFRITCQPEILAFELFRLDYQNISHIFLPNDDATGENNLERLEREYDLYRLYESHPNFSKSTLEWKCGFLDATITFIGGWDDGKLRTSPPYARIDPTLTITRSGSPILGPIRIFGPYRRQVITSIRTYGQSDQVPFVEVCSALQCRVRSALRSEEFEPVTDDDVTEWLRDPN